MPAPRLSGLPLRGGLPLALIRMQETCPACGQAATVVYQEVDVVERGKVPQFVTATCKSRGCKYGPRRSKRAEGAVGHS